MHRENRLYFDIFRVKQVKGGDFMQMIHLVARERIIKNVKTYEIYTDDYSIDVLDGIKYGPVRIIPDDTDPLDLFEELEQEFKELNPTFHANYFTICLEDQSEIFCYQC